MEQISAAHFGILPNTGADCTSQVPRLLTDYGHDAEIRFQPGAYCFSFEHAGNRSYRISNSDPAPIQRVGILLEHCQNLTLDFDGATLPFSDQLIALCLEHCQNITVKSASIDWDIPFTAEGTILFADSEQISVFVDPARYPHHVKDGKLLFEGSGWQSAFFGVIEFDRKSHLVRPGSGNTFPQVTVSQAQPGILIFVVISHWCLFPAICWFCATADGFIPVCSVRILGGFAWKI